LVCVCVSILFNKKNKKNKQKINKK
jgi:hypothetical protein